MQVKADHYINWLIHTIRHVTETFLFAVCENKINNKLDYQNINRIQIPPKRSSAENYMYEFEPDTKNDDSNK